MSLVVLEGVSLGFGGRTIIEDLGLRIGEQDRIGLVGRNGSGKSSLLRIVAGEQHADSGSVRAARGARIGYLPQEIEVEGGRTLLDSVLASVPGRADIESQLDDVQASLERSTETDEQMALAERLATLHEELAHFETNFSPHEARAILAGLGFKPEDADRDLLEFSGGWKMRALMAALLFQQPDLLMLDEPTNHLDIATVQWLGEFLRRFRGAMILICHDREFLNEQVNRIVSYEIEGVRQYAGDYENYRRLRAEELEILERRAVNVQRQREQNERFIRRFRAQATKARAVKSREKQLAKLDDVQTLGEERSLAFRFPPCARAGQNVVALEELGHSYDGTNQVFAGADLVARRGDRVAIVGPNAAGKTTLLKIVAGELAATAGAATSGHNVTPGYYAQHVTEKLHLKSTVLEEVWHASAIDDITSVRNVLGTFLFSEDDVDKPIAVLSGGEKARVALACLMVNPGNLLLMDEPTNHLDLESSEALAEALATYDGTLLFVSHNRSFINHLATRIWNVHDGLIEEFPGTFEEFRYHLGSHVEADAAVGGSAPAKGRGRVASTGSGSEVDRSDAASTAGKEASSEAGTGGRKRRRGKKPAAPREDPERRKQRRAAERQVAELETRIGELESVQAARSAELSKPEVFADRSRYDGLLGEYTEDASKLEELIARWEHAQASAAAFAE